MCVHTYICTHIFIYIVCVYNMYMYIYMVCVYIMHVYIYPLHLYSCLFKDVITPFSTLWCV